MFIFNYKLISKINKLSYLSRNLCQNCCFRTNIGTNFSKKFSYGPSPLHHSQNLTLQSKFKNVLLVPRRNIKTTQLRRNELDNSKIQNVGGLRKEARVKLKRKDLKRLLLLAKDEKWTITGKYLNLFINRCHTIMYNFYNINF